ncbi:MAG: phosphoribosyltransferase [Chlamydiales bacterium]
MITDLLFPPLCLHCHHPLEDRRRLFCALCTPFFELIEPSERCPYCFRKSRGVCKKCVADKEWRVKIASCLEESAPLLTLQNGLRNENRSLFTIAASWMVVQLDRLGWPVPDLICPVPSRLFATNPSPLIAKTLAQKLGCAFFPLLKRDWGDRPQEMQKERTKLDSAHFFWKRKRDLWQKTVLIVDDYYDSRATLRAVAHKLEEEYPYQIYAITLGERK